MKAIIRPSNCVLVEKSKNTLVNVDSDLNKITIFPHIILAMITGAVLKYACGQCNQMYLKVWDASLRQRKTRQIF